MAEVRTNFLAVQRSGTLLERNGLSEPVGTVKGQG